MCRPRVASSSAATASSPGSGLDGPKASAPRPRDGRGQSAQRGADHRQRGHGAAAHRRVRGTRDGQDRSERESRCQRTHHGEGRRVDGADRRTPASAKVAIDDSAATAARSTGSATAAPVPSPSRMRRSRIGSNPSAARASA